MKKKFLGIGIVLGLLIFVISPIQPVHADLEWSVTKQLELEATPLDISTSADGQMIFILVPGEILIYSVREDKEIKRIPVEGTFDSLIHSAKDNSLILSDSSGMKLMIIELENVFDISISDLPQKGTQNAPVTISVFNDYQWPYCGRVLPLLQQVLDKNPENVNIVFKNFPLAMHKSAKPAAAAALAAKKQDKFWEFHDKLFKNMKTLSDAKYQEIAAELELDLEKFNADLKDPAIQALITRDMKNGRESGVRGTPTIFVNGRLLKNRSLAGFQQKIDSELKKLEGSSVESEQE